MAVLVGMKDLDKRAPLKDLISISDALVFDYLMDDHDRKHNFNWMASKENTLLHWDSGMSFRHGPVGDVKCLEILCGPDSWLQSINAPTSPRSPTCSRIIRFSSRTIDFLRQHGPLAEADQQLSALWMNELQKEPLHPVFQFGTFLINPGDFFFERKVRFKTRFFLSGLMTRVDRLLRWVDECALTHGPENVLLPLPSPLS